MNRFSRTHPLLRRRLRIRRRQTIIASFAVETNYSLEMTDAALDALEDRVAAIEEIIAARWPRSIGVRRRVARELRASSATFAWAGTFQARRVEAMSEDVHNRTRRLS